MSDATRTVNCGVTAAAPSIPVPEAFNSSGVPLGFANIETQLTSLNSSISSIKTALETIATEATAIRKQGQVRALAGVAFTTTGTPTTLYTFTGAANRVKLRVTNTGASDYTFTLQRVSGAITQKLSGSTYTLSAGSELVWEIDGCASGDLIKGDANNAAVWLNVIGALE